MEIVMKKMETFCPRKDHRPAQPFRRLRGGGGRHRHGAGVLVPGLAGRWRTGRPPGGPGGRNGRCLCRGRTGYDLSDRAGPDHDPRQTVTPLLPHDFPPTLCTGHCNCTGRRASSLSVACPAAFLDALCHARSIRRVHKKTGKQTASCRMAAISLDSEKRLQYTFI